ncbi:hypothetical protein YC2023_090528 [Brassica napus]
MFCGVLSPLMNCIKPSSNKNTSPVRTDMRSRYSSDLKYYTSACQQDSDLKTFDSSLHQRTTSVMKSLADQAAKSQSISQGTLMEVYEFLLDLNRDIVRDIIESREHVRKNKDLTSLVDVYFKMKQFEESVYTDNKKNKYAKTLEELNKFKAMGDPFDGEFLTQYESVLLWREEDEVASILAMQEIKKIVDGLTDKIKEVGQHAAMCSGLIALGRLVFLKHIRSLPSNSVS